MFGRRPDGKRVKKLDPIIRMTPYLMPMRCDAQVFLEHKADYEKLSRYIAQKSREGEKITFMQVLAAAYVRAVSRNPEVNRFIFNKQFFARNNCSISYTVLKNPQDIHSNEDTVRILFDLTDTIFDVRDRMNAAVEKAAELCGDIRDGHVEAAPRGTAEDAACRYCDYRTVCHARRGDERPRDNND